MVGRYTAITSEILAVVLIVGALGRTVGPPFDGESIPMGVEDIVFPVITKLVDKGDRTRLYRVSKGIFGLVTLKTEHVVINISTT